MDEFEGVVHILTHRIAGQFARHGHIRQRESVVRLYSPEASDTREEGFPATGVAREIMRFDRSDDDHAIGIENGSVEQDGRSIAGMAHVHKVRRVAGVVRGAASAESVVVPSENLMVLVLRRSPVSACRDDETRPTLLQFTLDRVQNDVGGSRTGSIVHDYQYILAAGQEICERRRSCRRFHRAGYPCNWRHPSRLAFRTCQIVRFEYIERDSIGKHERYVSSEIRYIQFHHLLPAGEGACAIVSQFRDTARYAGTAALTRLYLYLTS